MALTIVETRAITGGVDTHADVHVAAALDPVGGLLGVQEFPVTPAGYARLLGWLGGFGTVCLVGIEGGWLGGFGTVCLVGIEGTGRTAAAAARPARWTRSAPRGPPSPAGPAARRRAGTGR